MGIGGCPVYFLLEGSNLDLTDFDRLVRFVVLVLLQSLLVTKGIDVQLQLVCGQALCFVLALDDIGLALDFDQCALCRGGFFLQASDGEVPALIALLILVDLFAEIRGPVVQKAQAFIVDLLFAFTLADIGHVIIYRFLADGKCLFLTDKIGLLFLDTRFLVGDLCGEGSLAGMLAIHLPVQVAVALLLLAYHYAGKLDALLLIDFLRFVVRFRLLCLFLQALHVFFNLEEQVFYSFQVSIGVFELLQRFLLALLEF